jgi:hypothetical protein
MNLLDLPEEILYIIAMMCIEVFTFVIEGSRFSCAFPSELPLVCRRLNLLFSDVIMIPRTLDFSHQRRFLDYLFANPILAPFMVPSKEMAIDLADYVESFRPRRQLTLETRYQKYIRFLVAPNLYSNVLVSRILPTIASIIYRIFSFMDNGTDILQLIIDRHFRYNPIYAQMYVKCCTKLGIILGYPTYNSLIDTSARVQVRMAVDANHRILGNNCTL